MNYEVIVSCAVTGAGDTVDKHPDIPVTPEQIANAAIEAAQAGAAIAHIHVRDVETGKGNRDPNLFRDVVERVRASGTDVIINLTAGMGGDWNPSEDDPAVGAPGSDMATPEQRLIHVEELRPDICSLDCGSLNFGESVYISPPHYLREMAQRIKDYGVKPEMEVFELGHLRFANQLVAEGLIEGSPLYQICLGIPWGAPADTSTMKAMVDQLHRAPSGRVSASRASRCRWSRRPCCWAATSASASRTTSISNAASSPRTASWSRRRSTSSN